MSFTTPSWHRKRLGAIEADQGTAQEWDHGRLLASDEGGRVSTKPIYPLPGLWASPAPTCPATGSVLLPPARNSFMEQIVLAIGLPGITQRSTAWRLRRKISLSARLAKPMLKRTRTLTITPDGPIEPSGSGIAANCSRARERPCHSTSHRPASHGLLLACCLFWGAIIHLTKNPHPEPEILLASLAACRQSEPCHGRDRRGTVECICHLDGASGIAPATCRHMRSGALAVPEKSHAEPPAGARRGQSKLGRTFKPFGWATVDKQVLATSSCRPWPYGFRRSFESLSQRQARSATIGSSNLDSLLHLIPTQPCLP